MVLPLVLSLCLLPCWAQAQTLPARRPATPKPKPSVAKTKPAPAVPKAAFPIRTLKVEGAQQLPVEGILQVAGLKLGQPAENTVFEAARQRLADTGLFERVGYRYTPTSDNTGFDATIIVTEIGQLLPFRFEDLDGALLTKALRDADPLYGQQLSATPIALKRYNGILAAAAKAPVAARVTADGPGKLVIVFRPDRDDPTISQVSFKGNEILPSALLQTTINGVAIGATFKEDRMREYLENAIRPLYESRGRIAVAFSRITAAPAAENKGLDVTVELVEGPSYELGQIDVVGEGDLRQLSRALELSSGDLANMDAVQEGVARMRSDLRKQGFLKNEVKVERKPVQAAKPGDKNVLNLVISTKTGPQYLFRKLTIQGLDILNEPQLRKMWAIETGSPFNGDYPDFFLKRIREDRLFDDLGSTKALTQIDDAAHQADVTLVFGKAERAPGRKSRK
jgi:outer membrane protein insertion porin family